MFAVIGERLRSCNSSIIRLRNGVIPTNSFRLLVYPFIYIHCSGTQPPRTPTLPLSSTPARAPPAACGCVQTGFHENGRLSASERLPLSAHPTLQAESQETYAPS